MANNVPEVGAESGETRCQGDMEKADMVDGEDSLGKHLKAREAPLLHL